MITIRRSSLVLVVIFCISLLTVLPVPAPPTVHAAPINENENSNESGFNDTAANAQVLANIGLNNPVHAAIGQPGDVDWFAFDVVAGQGYVVELFDVNQSLGTVQGNNCSSYARKGVWSAVYTSVSATTPLSRMCNNNAGGNVLQEHAFIASSTGQFFVRVAAHAPTVSGSYRLRILPGYSVSGADWNPMTFEPNNSGFNAYLIQPGKDNALTAAIEPHGSGLYSEKADVDWYRFETEPNRTYTIELFDAASSLASTGGNNCSSYSRSGLWLKAYDGSTEVASTCTTSPGVHVHTNIVTPPAGAGGTIFIRVTAHADTVSGSYRIRVLPRYDEAGAAWDSVTFEPNNRAANAFQITPGYSTVLRSTIEARDTRYSTEYADKDWYRFQAEAGRSYRIEVFDVDGSLSESTGSNCSSYSRSGLWLELLGPAFNSLKRECTNNGTNPVQTFIQLDNASSSTYYFSVMPHANTVDGNYSVRVRPLYCNNVTQISEATCETLVTLYEWLDGPNWTKRDGWLITNTPCSWHGVQCTGNQITGLNLANNNLRGPLPDAISTLNNLRNLRLDGNPNLTGKLPAAMTRVAGLQTFRFASTGLCEQDNPTFQGWIDSIQAADRAHLCGAVLNLNKSVSATTARPGDTLTYSLVVDGNGGPTLFTLADTLPAGLSYVDGSLTAGSYNPGSREISYSGVVSTTQTVTITYRAIVNANVASGTIIANTASASSATQVLEESVSVAIANPQAINTLVLIYYGADNDLAPDGLNVLNSAEQAANNPHAVVLMMLDGPGPRDAFLYLLQPDTTANCPNYTNPTCNGRYVLGKNMWEWPDLTADASALADFISGALLAYPNADQVILSIIGHGSGISAAGLADQPGRRQHRYDPLAGLLVDNYPTVSSLSTRSLGDGLREGLARARAGGVRDARIDGLYLDACLMGMVEVAYEIRDSVDFLLVSPHIKWAVSEYDRHLKAIDGQRNTRQILEAWMTNEADLLAEHNHPHTYAVIDVGQIRGVQSALNNLSSALIASLSSDPANKARIKAAFEAADFFDSNGDYQLNPTSDTYVDLGSLLQTLGGQFPTNTAVQNAVGGVQTALNAAVVKRMHRNGFPHMAPETAWTWETFSGLSIYAPLSTDGWQRRYYTERHFQAIADGQWANLLTAYWGGDPPQVPGSSSLPLARLATDFEPAATPTATTTPEPAVTPTATATPEPINNSASVYLPLVIR